MRKIDLIVIHCSATREDIPLSPLELDRMHRQRGFNGCGYHYYVRRDGQICSMRPVERIGAHAKGFNEHSIGICYEGGLDRKGRPADTRTERQRYSLRALVKVLRKDYPEVKKVCGHRDLSPDLNGNGTIEPEEWLKQCPCFDVATRL
ncbi:N-acetylmuramoyl-L-alanine amidase [uncultured Bacteroides sp.]|uniref:N-acetylmuramoyl-L-alanine amidase n=1 Tax=uncultured Bacteroides sp. TaxID=162156 RepID=UPI0026051044|nr:N-acetylmuramoyl-L-alanine amidase [uncultured Bacteroides sp.]